MAITTAKRSSVVGVRFQKLGKLYHFKLGQKQEIEPGDHVIVDTQRGRQLGQVIAYIDTKQATNRKKLRGIGRKATSRDLVLKQTWEAKELEALISCRAMASELRLKNAKFVKAEYSYDGSRLTIHYATENKKLNVNQLQKKLNEQFDTHIEMRVIGPRDVAKLLGGYGACGIARCCSTFLTEFSPVSIRMAKAQGISLSPQEITGMCGRLRCCLVYEYEQYVAARKTLPKRGKRIGTPHGIGRVRDVRILRESVLVEIEGERHEVFRDDIIPLAEYEALQKKAAAGGGCSIHGGGGCNCNTKNGARKETRR